MKTLLIVIACSIIFTGCANMQMQLLETEKPTYPTKRDFKANFEKVWLSTLQTLHDYPLTVIEKNSGLINTDWLGKTSKYKVSVWRGLIYGGRVEEDMPCDIMERLNILVTQKDSLTVVDIKRYVKLRPYQMVSGPKGSWTPNVNGGYEQTYSNTLTENEILNEIEAKIY